MGLPLGQQLAAEGWRVKGSTTTAEKTDGLRKVGIEPYLLRFDPILEGEGEGFFDADVLFLNIPPPRGRLNVVSYFSRQLRAVRKQMASSPVRHLLFASTSGVYLSLNRVVEEEDATPGQAFPEGMLRSSGAAVRIAEGLFTKLDGLSTTILRFGGLYGADRHPGRFMAGRKDLAGGSDPVNLVHRSDCLGVIRAALDQGAFGEVFNVCADEHPSRQVLYRAAARQLGLEPPTFTNRSESSYKIVSNQKVKRRLGYRFLHPDPLEDVNGAVQGG